jgi:hypothetical protein
MLPVPATTPSESGRLRSRPNPVARCCRADPSSTRLRSSSSRASRARAPSPGRRVAGSRLGSRRAGCRSRSSPSGRSGSGSGPGRGGSGAGVRTRAAFCPPKPIEVDRTASRATVRGSPATTSRSISGSWVVRFAVGGTSPSRSAWIAKAASTAPAAPSRWPVTPLVEVTAIRSVWSPKTARIARDSATSLSGVEVPWALRWPMVLGSMPASSTARWMARIGAAAVLGRGGGVERVGGRAAAGEHREGRRAAAGGVLGGLDDQDPAPSPITNPSRSTSKGRDACDGSGLRDRAPICAKALMESPVIPASTPPAMHDVGRAGGDQVARDVQRRRPRRTGGVDGEVRSACAGADRDRARRRVGQHLGHEHRADPARSLVEVPRVLVLPGLGPTDTRADDDADPVGVGAAVIGVGIGVGQTRRARRPRGPRAARGG